MPPKPKRLFELSKPFESKHFSLSDTTEVPRIKWVKEAWNITLSRIGKQPKGWKLNTVLFPGGEIGMWYRQIARLTNAGISARQVDATLPEYEEHLVEGPPIETITFKRIGDEKDGVELESMGPRTKLRIGLKYFKNSMGNWQGEVVHFGGSK